MDCTQQCTSDDDCIGVRFQKTGGICQMGELKYRIDLANGVGVPVKVAKGSLPEKGTYPRNHKCCRNLAL